MQKWEFLRITYQIEFKGIVNIESIPLVKVLRDGKEVEHKGLDSTEFLRSLGEDGWELVSAAAPSGHQLSGGASPHEILWFKRPILS
jgi:hypothetical protein